jgi:prephenate dehydratase
MAVDASPAPGNAPALHLGYLGPHGTFTEEALLSEPEYAAGRHTAFGSLVEVLDAVREDRVDLAFVPLENAIEGTVRDIVDSLIFDADLRIQREVVLDIHLHLLARPETALDEVEAVASIPMASAQCRRFLVERLPRAEILATNSTAEAARLVGTGDPALGPRTAAAIAPRLSAALYGLDLLAEDVEDHPDNQTRFVALARTGIPAPTGHDRTTIACFQRDDHPGSLHSILGQFSARDINLTKLESRPTKRALGEYCFLIDFEGHLADAVVADCLRDLHAELADVKFLGSYPAAGPRAPARRREADASRRAAADWVAALESEVRAPPPRS